MARILTLLPAGFEEIEAVTPIDLWRRAGLDVKTMSLTSDDWVTGRSGIPLKADLPLIGEEREDIFDLLFLPGGPGVGQLRQSPAVAKLLARHFEANRWIAAICAAPLVLNDAGFLSGRRYTAHPSTESELPEIKSKESVVVDGKIITSRGAGTALPFALKVIELLQGHDEARKIGLSICAETAY